MKNFFQSETATEACINGEIFVFGDAPESITEKTPCMYVGIDNGWGDGTEPKMELPIPDGNEGFDYMECRVFEIPKGALEHTTAQEKIQRFYNFNYENS